MKSRVIAQSRPRNPYVAAARFRQAGVHVDAQASRRGEERRELLRELACLDEQPTLPAPGKPPSP